MQLLLYHCYLRKKKENNWTNNSPWEKIVEFTFCNCLWSLSLFFSIFLRMPFLRNKSKWNFLVEGEKEVGDQFPSAFRRLFFLLFPIKKDPNFFYSSHPAFFSLPKTGEWDAFMCCKSQYISRSNFVLYWHFSYFRPFVCNEGKKLCPRCEGGL